MQWMASTVGLSVIGLLLIDRGIRFVEVRWEQIFPPILFYISIGIYLIGYFVFSRLVSLKPYLIVMTWVGFISLILSVFFINRILLRSVTLSPENNPVLPHHMIRHNRVLLGVILMLSFLLASWRQLTEGFFQILSKVIRWLFFILISLYPAENGGRQGGMDMAALFVVTLYHGSFDLERDMPAYGRFKAIACG